MFNGAKQTFGAPATNNAFGFGAANTTASPFGGQSAFGKPATQGFGAAPAFGQAATSAFGQPAQQQQQQQPNQSLFAAPGGQPSAFGAPSAQPGGFGGFGQPQQQQQQQQQLPLFGAAPQPAQNTSLFGQPSTSAFGAAAKAPAFGFGAAQPTTSLFSQPSTSAAAGTGGAFGGFGASAGIQQQAGGGMFGGGLAAGGQQQQQQSAFGQVAGGIGGVGVQGATGTAIAKYQESLGTDTLMKNGQSNNVSTKQHCITAMKEYEGKSFEELRMEDYMANRKGPQPGGGGLLGVGGGGGMFGATAAGGNQSLFGGANTMGGVASTSIFGQPAQPQGAQTMGAFGAPAANTTLGGAFGQQQSAFGQPQAGAAQPGGLFGAAANTGGGLFGAAKPFGQAATPATGGMFGQPSVSAAPTFGQPAQPLQQQTGAFGSFGQTQQQPLAAAPLFGQTAAATGGGLFGQTSQAPAAGGFGSFAQPATSQAGGGMFGQKPASTFGTLGTGAFGAPATSTASGFGSFGQAAAQPQNPSIFGSYKPPTTFGSFGAAAPLIQTAPGTGLSMFGNNAAKPGGLFGQTTQPQTTGMFGSGFGATNTSLGGGGGLGLGQSTLGGGLSFGGGLGTAQPPAAGIPIHQQILSMATSPYGDNPIFKDLQPLAGGLSADALKPTNPAAQKALLESAAASQFKVSPHVGRAAGLKLKPVGSSFSKKSLFGGLEEFDSSVEESFSLKPNAKRLIIKPKAPASTTSTPGANAGAMASPARTVDASGGSAHKRLNIPPTRSATPRSDDADGSFRNQIPLQAPAASGPESGRRESWLHSNALEKVTKQNRQPLDGGALDNTIQELVSGGGGGGADDRSGRPAVLLERRDNDEQPRAGAASTGKSSGGGLGAHTSSDSLCVSRSFLDDTVNTAGGDSSLLGGAGEPHPCGVTLLRSGYYTIPAIDSLVEYLAPDGSCRVDSLTIGRRGYGSVYFDTEIDVAGLNLDELVHFRHKEVIIYPDDENKPPVGCDLNRRAEVTLDQVWPHDKTLREPIKDRDRLEAMDYQGKLRRVCEKHDMRFVDYRPETGSWVFRVDHFSKYGLNDSDDEDDEPVDPKKAKMTAVPAGQQQNNAALLTKSASVFDREASVAKATMGGLGGGTDAIDRRFAGGETFVQHSGGAFQPLSPSSANAMDVGTDSHKLQLMKASFFVDDDFDGKSVASEQLDGRDSPDQTVPHPAYLRHHHHHRTGTSNILRHPTAPSSSIGGASIGSSMPAQSSCAASTITDNVSHRTLLAHAATKASNPPLLTSNFNSIITGVAPNTTTTIQRPVGPRSAPLRVRPKVALVRIPRTVIPLGKSILSQLLGGRSAVDMALQLGRTFRIGWTAPNAMLTLNTMAGSERLVPHQRTAMDSPQLIASLYAGRRPDDRTRSVLVLSRIASAAPISSLAASIEPHLQLQLRNTISETPAGDACPRRRAAPSPTGGGTSPLFAQHLEVARTNARLGDGADYVATVWSLCDALWGYQEELDGQQHGSHATVMRRRELLSEWLEAVVADEQQARNAKASYLEHMLDLLHTHRVTEACDLCFNNNDLNLAFMLAQLSGGPAVRQLVQHQLFAWQEVQADGFIAPERLRAYMLAAGVSLVSSAHGAINLFEELDWLRAFALNVWYLSAATASITDALVAYEHSYQSDEFQAQAPLPPYAGAYRAEPSSGAAVEDVRYHLLKLYARRSHPLESLLNPATHTADPMDFRLSWLLLQSLDAIGYRHCAAASVAQLHTSFAAQLEQAGLWHWAVFVLMHLADGRQRELAVQTMLYRYVRLSARDVVAVAETEADEEGEMGYAEKERFVVDELRVPVQWLLWAKAVRAGALGRWHAQAELLLQSEQWSMAHEVIMLHIAPEAIINDNIAYIHRLLQRFPDNGRSVPNWANQGGILLEYVRLGERFERLKTVPDAHADAAWLQLQQPLSELCSRINLFPCPTAKHRLCQSEIAQRLANLVSGMRLTGGPAGPTDISTCTLMRVILEKLPLPQEYAAQKLRVLLEDGRLIEEMQVQSEVR